MKILTCREMAEAVKERVDKNIPEKIANILDYYHYAGDNAKNELLYDIEFDVKGDLYFGDNEGIYLRMYIDGVFKENGEPAIVPLITYKTLCEDKDAMKMMAEIEAEFIWEANEWIVENKEQLIRRGWQVKKPENNYFSYICYTKENLRKKIKEGYCVVRDLKTQNILLKSEVKKIENCRI